MRVNTWIARLTGQLPGWYVWYALDGTAWNAVPADDRISHIAALRLPNRINASTPQALRALAKQRYGWHDYCQSCVGLLARECDHRQPESRDLR